MVQGHVWRRPMRHSCGPAFGCHSELATSQYAQRALEFMQATRRASRGCNAQFWRGNGVFAAMQAVARFDLAIAHDLIRDTLDYVTARQQENGTFGTSCKTERVLAALIALKALAGKRGVQQPVRP